jgi:uncharacterized YkwD family protein
MIKPFKVLATSSLLLMLVACNNNDNAAYDALTPNEDRDVTNVSDRRGDNLGDAFRMRNGNDTAEELDTANVGNRNGRNFGTNVGNRDYNFNGNRDNNNGFDTAFDQRRGSSNELAGNMNDSISADFTTINSQKFPHTRPIQIQEAKYGYVVMGPQGQRITASDIQSLTEKYTRQFRNQIAQGQMPGQLQQMPRGQQQQQAPTGQQPTVQQPTQQQPAPQKPTQQAPAAQPTKPTQQAPTQGISATEQKVIDLTNAERRKAGLKDLVGDTKLSSVARTKSNDMQKNGYFSHTSPTYGSPFDMMRDFGVSYSTAGENIAQGQRTPEEVVRAWMNSEGHRKNILNGAYTHIGVGHDTTGNHWTQMFIGK